MSRMASARPGSVRKSINSVSYPRRAHAVSNMVVTVTPTIQYSSLNVRTTQSDSEYSSGLSGSGARYASRAESRARGCSTISVYMPVPEPGRVARILPADAPFVEVRVHAGVVRVIRIVAVCPSHRGEEHVLPQHPLQLVCVPAAVGVMMGARRKINAPAKALGKLGRKADLHGAAVGCFVAECHSDAFPVFHRALHYL